MSKIDLHSELAEIIQMGKSHEETHEWVRRVLRSQLTEIAKVIAAQTGAEQAPIVETDPDEQGDIDFYVKAPGLEGRLFRIKGQTWRDGTTIHICLTAQWKFPEWDNYRTPYKVRANTKVKTIPHIKQWITHSFLHLYRSHMQGKLDSPCHYY